MVGKGQSLEALDPCWPGLVAAPHRVPGLWIPGRDPATTGQASAAASHRSTRSSAAGPDFPPLGRGWTLTSLTPTQGGMSGKAGPEGSLADLNGIDLMPVQDTPVASRKEDTYVHFNVDIELQKHVEKLTKGAAVFFEFKHFKPKKRFTSTKCFTFMEMDELKPRLIVIELYRKPSDFKRKKLVITKKPLYLHLHQTLHKD
ncbi:axin interactor, dorsalization-associated protein-like [Cavia porcellus]|uniref:axin interactor, dorsalization-associated protein-like n=1 Tax=Cavia porcellus TaxID=10141 RepID=UPI002FE39C76